MRDDDQLEVGDAATLRGHLRHLHERLGAHEDGPDPALRQL